ncbi:MAG: precorrin-6A reductase [Pseudomonadota bacterium]
MAKILLLGGTEEARELAERLEEQGAAFVAWLAGLTDDAGYRGETRIGGLGGAHGLERIIVQDGFGVVVDATHPFAATISPNARMAAKAARVPYYRLERMPWRRAVTDRWVDVRSLEEAAEQLDAGSTVFLAVGAGGVAPFLPRRDVNLVARTIEAPYVGRRHDMVIIQARGPFDVEDERELWDKYRFDAMVTKNSGGDATAAKLVVARERRTRVFMVKRPRGQPWPSARTVDRMMRKLRRHL